MAGVAAAGSTGERAGTPGFDTFACGLAAAGVVFEVLPVSHPAAGVFAFGALLICVVTAEWIYRRRSHGARVFVLMLAVVAALLTVALLPDTLGAHGARAQNGVDLAPWLRLILLGGSSYLILKMMLLHRYAPVPRRAMAALTSGLLPFQQRSNERLRNAITAPRLSNEDARIVQFEGRWGEGKTRVLTALVDDLRGAGWTVVEIDVWKHETARALDVAILEEILSCPVFLRRYGWLGYPLTLLIASIRDLGVRVTARLGHYGDLSFQLPKLGYQRVLERLLKTSRGEKMVIVFDEIDRAAPAVVQAALTLTRRSLDDVPHLCIVLAYVPAAITYKAFNPLTEQLPDLASSTFAELLQAFDEQDRAWLGDVINTHASRGNLGQNVIPRWLTRERDEHLLERALRLYFARQSSGYRNALQRRVGEKHLNTTPITMSSLDKDDFVQMVNTFPVIVALLSALLTPFPDPAFSNGLAACAKAWTTEMWRPLRPARKRFPPIRTLGGNIVRYLDNEVMEGDRCSMAEVTFLVLVALDVADRAW